jgi:hypothetical protein
VAYSTQRWAASQIVEEMKDPARTKAEKLQVCFQLLFLRSKY